MLLAIDVGNTGLGIGIFEGEKLRVTWRMATSISRTPDEYAALLFALLQQEGLKTADITDVCFCSVVPPVTCTLENLCSRYFHIKPLVVGAGTKTGVKIRMDNPREIGPDRIVHSAAAHLLYGGPLIIVDMGTATTFDTITKNGEYTGGAIAPGFQTAAEALFARTAMLPRVNLMRPAKAIGTNTDHCHAVRYCFRLCRPDRGHGQPDSKRTARKSQGYSHRRLSGYYCQRDQCY